MKNDSVHNYDVNNVPNTAEPQLLSPLIKIKVDSE